jgi:electron transport complex protein RnfG
MNYILKPALTLFITSVIIIAAVSIAYDLTVEPIARQHLRTRENAMLAVLPSASEFRELTVQKSGSIISVHEALDSGAVTGYVIALSPIGYSGNIDLVVGINSLEENISGVRILRHSETPGLGALAARQNFYSRFDGKALVPLTVIRAGTAGANEINAITASTITSNAVTNAVNEAIVWYNQRSGR